MCLIPVWCPHVVGPAPFSRDTVAGTLPVWTSTPPEGWEVNRTGIDPLGIVEFTGWTFVTQKWWGIIDTTSAANRYRASFDRPGNIAVLDGDEYNDSPFLGGNQRQISSLTSPLVRGSLVCCEGSIWFC